MKQHTLSAGKRFAKPFLLGTIIFGLSVAFYNRHRFFSDVEEIRAEERAKYNEKLADVLERRQKLIRQVEEKQQQQQQSR